MVNKPGYSPFIDPSKSNDSVGKQPIPSKITESTAIPLENIGKTFTQPPSKVLRTITSFKEQNGDKMIEPTGGEASEVVFIPSTTGVSLFAKPGLGDGRLAMMAYAVLEKVGLAHTMPEMKLGTLDHLLSHEFETPLLVKKNNNGTYAIEKGAAIDVTGKSLNNGAVLSYEGVDYKISVQNDGRIVLNLIEIEDSTEEEDVESVERKDIQSDSEEGEEESWRDDLEGETYEIFTDSMGNQFLAPSADLIKLIDKENDPDHYVMINEFPYKLEPHDGGYRPVGYRVPTLYMEKVEHLWHGSGKGGLDIVYGRTPVEKEERELFYQRINRSAFIDSFIASILTRPQDGKIVSLENESNYLFKEELDGSLSIVQIDPDHLMPPNNHTSVAEWIKETETVIPIRCGLVGFPMAREKLKGSDLTHLKEVVARCTESEVSARRIIKLYGKTAEDQEGPSQMTIDRQNAYSEVVGRLREFLNQHQEDFSLQEMFFYVFPEYKLQYEFLIQKGRSHEEAALRVGGESTQFTLERP